MQRSKLTRRRLLAQLSGATLASASASASPHAQAANDRHSGSEQRSLTGEWDFAVDPHDVGVSQDWASHVFAPGAQDRRSVTVPHTWQIEPALADYYGIAWYRRRFSAPTRWAESMVRIEFEAVFHSATIWVNGVLAGQHRRKGYTAFSLDISHLLHFGQENTIVVRVDNSFDDHMVPRGRSSDWATDGGIVRPVQLLITPRAFIATVDVEALPDADHSEGRVTIVAHIRNSAARRWSGDIAFHVVDLATGLDVPNTVHSERLSLPSRSSVERPVSLVIKAPKLWHFDHPHLYSLEIALRNSQTEHRTSTAFGVRQLAVTNGGFYLNGEPVQLIGVERMAGSDPRLGMAESVQRIQQDLADLKHLNCIFSRTHWPQDRRVLDYCDRHGILMQCEVPAWGHETFFNMGDEPDADILENALEQLREMIASDRNHPCIVAWGLCNEVNGQTPPVYKFASQLLKEAKRLDPNRLCSYAANTLFQTPEKDVAGLMDFIETNEYFGSWQSGSSVDVQTHLRSLRSAFPNKPVVVSEYGYCACAPGLPEGDQSRIDILKSHTAAMRGENNVSGAIFFCYNDYRTHMGDSGLGVLRQRVSGVVDILGARKPSFEVLRSESSPIANLTVTHVGVHFEFRLQARNRLPKYSLHGYRLQANRYGSNGILVEQQEIALPTIAPGAEVMVALEFGALETGTRLRVEVLRPTDHSAYSLEWRAQAIDRPV